MRLYFVGAHATGKTTLARIWAKRLNLPLITEVARSVLAELETSLLALRVDLDATGAYQAAVFQRQLEIEARHAGGFVSDRSALDSLPYAALHSTSYARIRQGLTADYLAGLRQAQVFFLRPHRLLLQEDGVRAAVDWDSVIRIDGMVKMLLEEFEIPYTSIDAVEMSDRCRAVEAALRST